MTDDEIFQLVKQAGGAWVPRRGFAPHLEMTEDQLFRFVELISKPVECMCGICKLAPRQWQGLTEEETIGASCECIDDGTFNMDCAIDFARLIEAKIKEKNT